MANKYLDYDGLLYFWSKIKSVFVAKEAGKTLSTNDYTTAEKNKLAGIASGAEVNVQSDWNVTNTSSDAYIKNKPNSIKTVSVDSAYNISAATSADTIGFITGANITLTANETNKTITFSATDTTYSEATSSVAGLMSASDKAKLTGVEAGAQENVIESVKVNGTALTITNKAVDVEVPVVSVEKETNVNLVTLETNDGNYYSLPILDDDDSTIDYAFLPLATTGEAGAVQLTNTISANNGYVPTSMVVKSYVDSAIGSITGIEFRIVQALPASGENGVIYLLSNGGSSGNSYDEYIWIASTSSFEKIGTTDIDLSGYMLKTDMVPITNAEIDTIAAS